MNNVTSKVNSGRSESRFDIASVEKKYNAKYVGQLCLRVAGGGWHGDDFGEIFYQEKPPVEGYSHYFALVVQRGTVYIASGASAVEGLINAVVADDGEIIYSRYRHDWRKSTDGTVWIDGGRDYVHSGTHGKFIMLKIVDGEFYEVDESEIPGGENEQA